MQPSREVFEFGRLQGEFPIWAAVAASVVAAVCWRLYSREPVGTSRWTGYALLSLRLAAFAVLAVVFLDPRLRTETTIRQLPRIALLVDRSRSMAHVDPNPSSDKRSRFARAAAALDEAAAEGAWGEREVAAYSFGAALETHAGAWRDVRPDGDSTRLADAVVEALQKDAAHPPAALVVVSDGRSNAGSPIDAAVRAARQARIAVHSVAVGSDLAPPNLRLADLRIPGRVYRGDQVKGSVLVQSTGLTNAPADVTFTLKAKGGGGARKVGGAVVPNVGDGAGATASLSFEPPPPGTWELVASTPVRPGEVDAADNRTTASFEVVDRRSKVLLFSGGPSREYQFLRNLLFRDSTVELSVLLQTAPRGASQEAKQVLARFPATREELFAYDCLIALEPDWSRVDSAGLAAVVEWTSKRAGGLFLVGGAGPAEIEGLSPVVPGESEVGGAPSRDAWPLELTLEGEAAPALRLADDAAASKKLWEEFSGFYDVQKTGRLKPGATVWLRSTDPRRRSPGTNEPAPVMAVQFFGGGRTAWLASAELWRLRRMGEKYYERLWTQMIRQLSEGRLLRGSGRGALIVERKTLPPGASAMVRAWLLDDRFQPFKAPSVRLSVSTSAGPREADLAAQPGQPGRYAAALTGLPPGEVRLQLLLSGGEVLEESLRVAESSMETDDLRSDRPALKRLANETGGEAVEIGELRRLIAGLPSEPEESVVSSAPRPLWDRGWVAGLFVALLAAEWILRKLHNLA